MTHTYLPNNALLLVTLLGAGACQAFPPMADSVRPSSHMARLQNTDSQEAAALVADIFTGQFACAPLGYEKADLLTLKAGGFKIDDPKQREQFALELLTCLGSPDPEVRDGVAYEAYVAMLRGKQLGNGAIKNLRGELITQLNDAQNDPLGFRRPFAALVLSEVARSDRVDPVFTNAQRAELVAASTRYMRSINDYRGFDEQHGWRHGVAHGADLMMQLVLNPDVSREQLIDIRNAVAAQVVPGGAHFYTYGESGRLARPILFMANREEFSEQEWLDWMQVLAAPAPFFSWSDIWSTQAGLAKLHNTKAFAQAIYVNASTSKNSGIAAMAPAALEVLKALP